MSGEGNRQGAASGPGHPCSAPNPQAVSALPGGSPSREASLALVANHLAALRDDARAMDATADLFRPEFDACWVREPDGQLGGMLAPERALQLRPLVITNPELAKANRQLADAIEALIAPCDEPVASAQDLKEDCLALHQEIDALTHSLDVAKQERDAAFDGHDKANSALAESERKRVEAEAEIEAARARLPESLRDGKMEFCVANLAMAYAGANDRWWRYGYATRLLLDFAERSAGEGYCFTAEEGRPAIDAADLCYTVARLIGCELGDSRYNLLLKPVTEPELAPYLASTPTQETTHVEG